ncbi:MAG: HlyD family efflux transporter periplasmic adaptor subunit [Opitutus sp.]
MALNLSSPAVSAQNKKRPGDKPRRRYLVWTGTALLVLLIVAGLWPKPLPVEVAAVSRGDVLVTVNEEGMTRVKNRYVVSSPVAGQLQRIEWKAGAVVKAGETVLATLETGGADLLDVRGQAQAEARVRAAESSVERAGAQLASARATATLASSDLNRFRGLAGRGAISQQDLESATMREATATQEVRAAEFGEQVARFELEQARALLLRGQPGGNASQAPIVITSPVSGRVLRVFQESSRLVTGGLALLEVGDPTDLELRIEVLSRDGVAIRPGARVLVDQWGGPTSLEARVRLVEPSAFTKISALGVEEQRVYVVADFVSPVEQRPTLGDSYRIEARIVVWEGKNVLRVPAGALFQRGQQWQTFVVAHGKTALRDVKAGRSNGLETEILDGLREGERVVLYPGDKVAEGSRVREISVAIK